MIATDLMEQRYLNWHQTAETKIATPEEGARLINAAGVVSHFQASPELPNLYHAYMGSPDAKSEATWDSPAGHIYTWRWHLGGVRAGFYSVLVKKRPTWISWDLLPAMLRLRGELRTPDELFDLGKISANAYKIAQTLEQAGGILSTADLRKEAGFPTGKEHRAAYLKAVEELDSRLMLAKELTSGEDEMNHALVFVAYRDQAVAADRMSLEEACDRFLAVYLPQAAFAAPIPLARHLGIDESNLRAALDRTVATGAATRVVMQGYKGDCYASAQSALTPSPSPTV